MARATGDDLGEALGADSAYVFNVDCALPGDMDGDGDVDLADLPLFVDVLHCVDGNLDHAARADVNRNGGPNGLDVQGFLDILF